MAYSRNQKTEADLRIFTINHTPSAIRSHDRQMAYSRDKKIEPDFRNLGHKPFAISHLLP